MSAYYLIATLPTLQLEQAAPLAQEKLAQACDEQLASRDAEAVRAILTQGVSSHPFVVAWRDKETILRNAIAQQRAHEKGIEASRWLRGAAGCDLMIEREVEEAFQQGDPLRIERALDAIRWRIADELAGVDPMAVSVVFAYAVKLGLVLRWTALQADRGMDEFEQLTELAK